MAGPANKRCARGAGTPRKRFERRYDAPSSRTSTLRRSAARPRPRISAARRWPTASSILDVVEHPHGGPARAVPGRRLAVRRHRRLPSRVIDCVPASRRGVGDRRTGTPMPTGGASTVAHVARRRCRARQGDDAAGRGSGDVAGGHGVYRRAARHGRAVPRPATRSRSPPRSAGDDSPLAMPAGCGRLSAAAHAIDGLLEAACVARTSSLGRDPPGDRRRTRPPCWASPRSRCTRSCGAARSRGALIFAARRRARSSSVDRELLDAVVVMGAPALERAGRYDIDHEIALKLQRGMMSVPPFDLPETPWSAHYSSAATGLVGGDWYDVIDLDGSRRLRRSATSSVEGSTRPWRWVRCAAPVGRWPTASTSHTNSSRASTTSPRRPAAAKTRRWPI